MYAPTVPLYGVSASADATVSPAGSSSTSSTSTSTSAAGANSSTREWEALSLREERQFKVQLGELAPLRDLLGLKAAASRISPAERKQKLDATLQKYVQDILAQPEPDADYDGPRLPLPLTLESVTALVQYCKSRPKTPVHTRYVVQILVKVREELQNTYLSKGPVSQIQVRSGEHTKLVVVGDLHGQLADLLVIFNTHGLPSPTGTQYLFNGDFIDRGPNGVEILLILFAFKLLYPASVHLNRGNHEDSAISREYGFAREVGRKYSRGQMFNLFMNALLYIPLATVVDNAVFVVHGGLPRNKGLSITHIRDIEPQLSVPDHPTTQAEYTLIDLLWNDPGPSAGIHPSPRGPSSAVFGPDITESFLQHNHLSMVVRSHEVPSTNRGFEILHNGRLITVFSASNYCNVCGNQGAVMTFTSPGFYSFTEYYAPSLDDFLKWESKQKAVSAAEVRESAAKNAEQDVVRMALALVAQNRQSLYWYFRSLDAANTGLVTVTQWRTAMENVLGLNLTWDKYQACFVKTTADGKVQWKDFVESPRFDCDPKFGDWKQNVRRAIHDALIEAKLSLDQLRAAIDLNSDGTVDEDELARLLERYNLGLTGHQVRELLRGVPKKSDRGVDVIAFVETLQSQKAHSADVDEALDFLARLLNKRHESIMESFSACDENKDGRVQYEEFATAMLALLESTCSEADKDWKERLTHDALLKIVKECDQNNSGSLDYMEFVDALRRNSLVNSRGENVIHHICSTLHMYRSSLDNAFEEMDTDGDGELSLKEFEDGLHTLNVLLPPSLQLSDKEIRLVAESIDVNHDGRIDWQEFLSAFHLEARPLAAPTTTPAPAPSSGNTPRVQFQLQPAPAGAQYSSLSAVAPGLPLQLQPLGTAGGRGYPSFLQTAPTYAASAAPQASSPTPGTR
eukprot:RCo042620